MGLARLPVMPQVGPPWRVNNRLLNHTGKSLWVRNAALTKLYRPLCEESPRNGARGVWGHSGMYKTVMTTMVVAVATGTAMAPAAAHAAGPVQFASAVFVERFQPAPGGRVARVLERADQLRAGDRVIFVVNWKASRDRPFTVTNPLPRTIAFESTSDGVEEVSVDGGRNWGALETLTVGGANGHSRRALPEDVTHLRWRVPAQQALAGNGQMTWRGVVR